MEPQDRGTVPITDEILDAMGWPRRSEIIVADQGPAGRLDHDTARVRAVTAEANRQGDDDLLVIRPGDGRVDSSSDL